MSKFKRAVCFVAVVVLASTAFAGCALFERNVKHYNDLEVARIEGIAEPIRQKQLIDAFESFGYRYVSEYGYSLSKAYDETLDILINREIIAQISKDKFGGLTEQELAQARKVSFDAVERNLREREKTIREERKWPDRPGDETETLPEARPVYTPYEKYLIKQGNNFRINLERFRDRPAAEFIFETNEDFIKYLGQPRDGTTPVDDVRNSLELTIAIDAKDRFVRFLSISERGLGFKYDTEKQKNDAIIRELKRIQEQEEKNILVRRMQEAYEQGIVTEADYEQMLNLRDGVSRTGFVSAPNFPEYETFVAGRNQVFVDDLVRRAEAEYLSSVRVALDRFERGFDPIDGFRDKLLGGLEGLYFVPRQISNQFFTVSHILVEFNDEQKQKLEQIEEQYRQDQNENNRDSAIRQLRGQVEISRRVDGIETGTPMTAAEVLTYVENYVMPNSKTKSLQRKVTDFRDCIYMFNSDPGMQNPDFEYVIGVDLREDKSPRSQEQDTMSQMVPQFTAAARELFNYNEAENRGGVRQEWTKRYDESTGKYIDEYTYVDTRGTMSGLVWTDFGAHIIMYTRNIHDFIYTNTTSMLETSYQQFLHATQTSYGNKTIFDGLVERLSKPAYNQYEQQLLDVFKGENKITLLKKNYKNLTKKS